MALRVGYRGPCFDVRAEQKLLDAFWWIVDSRMARIAEQGIEPALEQRPRKEALGGLPGGGLHDRPGMQIQPEPTVGVICGDLNMARWRKDLADKEVAAASRWSGRWVVLSIAASRWSGRCASL